MTKHRYSKVAVIANETPESLRAEFPKALIDAYVACKNADFADTEHAKYVKLATKFLGDLASDPIEYGKLTVRLTKATYDLVDKKHAKKAEKEAKDEAKEDARPERSKRTLP